MFAAALFSLTAAAAQAAFPGQNGNILLQRAKKKEGAFLWRANPDGSGLERITSTTGGLASAAGGEAGSGGASYDGSGTKIVFTRPGGRDLGAGRQFLSDDDDEVWIMNADGSDQTPLTKNKRFDSHPELSPDGSKIVFQSTDISSGVSRHSVWIMNTNGSGVTLLDGSGLSPTFSPDGQTIIYENREGGINTGAVYSIFAMGLDGGGKRRITADGFAAQGPPDISPDGATVAFRANPGVDTYSIALQSLSGGGVSNLTPPSGAPIFDSLPVFSPDGSRVLFTRISSITTTNAVSVGGGSIQTLIGAAPALDWQPLPPGTTSAPLDLERCAGKKAAVSATPRRDMLPVGRGTLVVAALGGNDVVQAPFGKTTICGGAGKDSIYSVDYRPGPQDLIDCGGGRDTAVVDAKDRVKRNCEKVRIQRKKKG